MAKIPATRTASLLKKLLLLLKEHPEGMNASDALKTLAESVSLTEYEQEIYRGHLRFHNVVQYATIAPTRMGWIIKKDGKWMISQEGEEALQKYPDPLALRKTAQDFYSRWKKNLPPKEDAQESVKNTTELSEEEEEIEEAMNSPRLHFEQASAQAQTFISDYVGSMHPYDFQKLVAALLQAMGYHILWDAETPGPDGGVDILACSDPLGMQEPRIKVQVKRQKSAVSLPDIKSFIANVGPRDAGIFVCTGGFTNEAKKHARTLENRQITTIDQEKLIKLWIEYSHKLDDQSRLLLPLVPTYFLYPPE